MKFLSVFVVLVVLAFSSQALAQDAWVGKAAPDFEVTDTNGTPYKLSDLAGDNVVWLNFWGLRCGPCVRELPALEDIYKRYKDKGLIILGINADGVDSAFIKKSFDQREDLSAINITFPLIPDVAFSLIDTYELMGAPLNVIIDRKGVVKFYHEGYEIGDEKQYEEIVKGLL
jgi:peroxiredoxin